MMQLTFSPEILKEHFLRYFETSLVYYPEKYLGFFLTDGDEIPNHEAYLCQICLSNFIVILLENGDMKVLASSNFDLYH
jgi:hypothetical protein